MSKKNKSKKNKMSFTYHVSFEFYREYDRKKRIICRKRDCNGELEQVLSFDPNIREGRVIKDPDFDGDWVDIQGYHIDVPVEEQVYICNLFRNEIKEWYKELVPNGWKKYEEGCGIYVLGDDRD